MLNLNSIMIGSGDVKTLAKFYEEVFQKKADMEEGEFFGWAVGNGFISVGAHSDVKGKSNNPERFMFNLETDEVEKEFARISKIDGVTVVKEPYEMGEAWIATLADPDGNYFQLMTPWEEAKKESN